MQDSNFTSSQDNPSTSSRNVFRGQAESNPQPQNTFSNYLDDYQQSVNQQNTPSNPVNENTLPDQENGPINPPPAYYPDDAGSEESMENYDQNGYDQYTEYFPGIAKPLQEETVYAWEAPSRPFKERSKQFYTTIITIATLISLILFFANQLLPIAVIVAVVFLFYVLSSIPPEKVITQFTTFGIRYDDNLYFWEELGNFWFDEAFGQEMVQLEVIRFPNRLTLMIGGGDKALIKEMLSEILIQQKPLPTIYEKAAAWLSEKIPLDLDK